MNKEYKFTIAVIGNGFVGGATKQLECDDIKLLVYDIIPEKCIPYNLELENLQVCDFIFICVPTPMDNEKKCYTGIVESVIKDLLSAEIDFNKTNVVIRSTVPPGTSNNLNCFFMPEFLTEANYINDFINTQDWIIGCGKDSIDEKFLNSFQELLTTAKNNNKIKYDNVKSLLISEAELVKYTRNSFLATKVAFFNEIYTLCKSLNIDYDNMISGVTCDSRIGTSHTKVPGPDGHRGFGGTCFPKDTNALNQFSKDVLDYNPPLLNAVIFRNENIDRKEKDWESDKRAKL